MKWQLATTRCNLTVQIIRDKLTGNSTFPSKFQKQNQSLCLRRDSQQASWDSVWSFHSKRSHEVWNSSFDLGQHGGNDLVEVITRTQEPSEIATYQALKFRQGTWITPLWGTQLLQKENPPTLLTLSLPRVIKFKFLLHSHQQYYITQYEELGFS